MTVVLVLTSVVIMLSILLNKISERVGMPVLLAFILLGMLFGSDGLFKIRFDDFKFAEIICSTALIFIMFYGGFGTRWSAARKIARERPSARPASVGREIGRASGRERV